MVHAPLSVLPAPFPAASFRKACDAAPAFSLLIAAVAADSDYLQRTLAPAAEYDDFTVSCRAGALSTLQLQVWKINSICSW